MKKYHVATGDGKAYYGVGYESYREAEGVLEFSQRHDPQAHIVEEEYHFTKADRIRAMTDKELAEKIHSLYHNIVTGTMDDISCLFCDGKAGCITEEGNIICDEEKEKACVLRWLQRPAEED